MKRLILTMFLVLAAGFVFYGTADAGVTGLCSSCHTMHASQDGTTTTPSELLVKGATCLGCHTGTGVTGAPIVDAATGTMVGSGSFADAVATSQTHTHNVADLTAGGFTTGDADTLHTDNDPPGFGGASGYFSGTKQLKCAGAYGCHGDHTKTSSLQGIQGYHHGGGGYKFLEIGANNAANTTAVTGTRSSDWEKSGATTSDHNVYNTGSSGISMFCNNCHDVFHGTATTDLGGDGVWERHPTDIAVTELHNTGLTAGEQTSFNNSLDPDAHPLAFVDGGATIATGNMTNYNYDNGYVMCLSCHRAHGSQYADILRYDYSGVSAGSNGTTGCLGCHIPKR